MDMRNLGSIFSVAARQVSSVGQTNSGAGGNGGGYFGNQGQKKGKRDGEAMPKKAFGVDGMSFTSFNQLQR